METREATRERLLELWEKCPECRSKHIDTQQWYNGLRWTLNDESDLDGAIEAFACDAMVRWLATQEGEITITRLETRGTTLAGWYTIHTDLHESLTDALISAVEAVMETSLKAEEQADGTS